MFRSRIIKQSFRSYSSSIASEIKLRGPWYYPNEPISSSHVEKLNTSFAGYIPSQTSPFQEGQILPAGFHLIFFNNTSPESDLASDGYHKDQAPDESKFPARMWLGGSVEFNHDAKQLRVGSSCSAMEQINSTRFLSTEAGPSTVERLDVVLDRFLYGSGLTASQMDPSNPSQQWAIKETRSIAYFCPQAGVKRGSNFNRFLKPPSGATHRLSLTPSNVLLFRYSALTFNSHRIHYDPLYSQQVEGLPDCIVHGPLSLSLLMNWIASTVLSPDAKIKSFSYKNLLPMFVNQELTLCASVNSSDKITIWIENQNGSLTMTGCLKLN